MNAGRGIGSGGGIGVRSVGRQTTPPAAPSTLRLWQYTWPTASVTLVLAPSVHGAIAQILASSHGSGPLDVSRLRPVEALLLTLDHDQAEHLAAVEACESQTGEPPPGPHHYGWKVGDVSQQTLAQWPTADAVIAAGEREFAEMTQAVADFKAGGR